eukprot:gnl/TRDRNA2_/TRDRNA2_81206_c0_seq1.p1 gnl/TRDRNA2_/TRDRNA2_81206_c0~~gnl/TRDRNA2_/TRDRNA2_81206_c0_seq1.p1  ORF type:complete len:149 (+),score=10.28 gnl/TRDRNA2_/TRDRNA2_81206_c0_seq1:57-449(+)
MGLYINPQCQAWIERVNKEMSIEANHISSGALSGEGVSFEMLLFGGSPSSMQHTRSASSRSNRRGSDALSAGGALAMDGALVRSVSGAGLPPSRKGSVASSQAGSFAGSSQRRSVAGSLTPSRLSTGRPR